MKTAMVFLANGCEEVEAVTPVDFLRRGGVEVTVVGIGDREIQTARGLTIRTDVAMDQWVGEDHPLPDAIVLPGGMPGAQNLADDPHLDRLVRTMAEEKRLIAGICAAPAVVLGSKGLLKGRAYTCYPGFEESLDHGSFREDRVVVDENFITSRGPGTAAEFSLTLLSALMGPETSQKIKKATLQK